MRLFSIFILCCAFFACQRNEKKTEDLSALRIAYNVYYDTASDDYEIFVMKADGSGQKNISNSSGVDWVYYAYKDKLYFLSDRDTTHRVYFLYEMDADGNNVRKVSNLRLEDSWMSSRNDGKEMVVSGRVGKEVRYQLFLLDITSGDFSQLTTDTTASFADPCFSPDGKQIIFRHRTNRRNFVNEKAELWIMNADGTDKKQLTHYPEDDTTAEWHSYHAGPPYWEPNRNLISYISRQKGNHSIFTISPNGGASVQLTPDSNHEGWHAWSPVGEWIVYDGSDLSDSDYDIFLMRADGSGTKRLTTDWRTEQAPVFVAAPR